MSKTKGGGSTRNGRDSNAQRLGVKVYDGTKINGFTYKKKTNQRRRYGHRQHYTVVEITSITTS